MSFNFINISSLDGMSGGGWQFHAVVNLKFKYLEKYSLPKYKI